MTATVTRWVELYEGRHRCESGRFYDELVWVLVTYCGRHRARTGFLI